MTLFSLAWRLAFSHDVRQRWRQLSVIVATCVASAFILLGVAVTSASMVSDNKILARSPAIAEEPSGAVLDAAPRGLVISEREDLSQFPVLWLQPRPGQESNPVAVPPGLSDLPGPGEGVLSPGLIARGYAPEDFGLKPSQVGLGPGGAIGEEGLTTQSEGWIYARPPAGRTLGEGGILLPLSGYVDGADADNRLNLETVPELPSGATSLVGAIWLIAGPALLLALGSARSMSALRLQRASTLNRLGIAEWRVRTLLGVETVLLAGTGAVGGVVLWLTVGQFAESVTLTNVRLLPRALAISPVLIAATTALVVGTVGIVGMSGSMSAGRSAAPRREPRFWHLVPLGVSIAMMMASRLATPMSGAAAYLLFGGVVLCMASLPLATPLLAQAAGRRLVENSRPGVWLAGRRLTRDPVTLARPAAAVGALVLIAGAAFAIYGRITAGTEDLDQPSRMMSGQVAQVNWRDERPEDVDWAIRQLPELLAAPTGVNADGSPVVILSDCWSAADAVTIGREAWCSSRKSFSDSGYEAFRAITHFEPLVGRGDAQVDSFNLLLLSQSVIDQREVMRALAPQLPAVNTSSNAPSAPYVPVGWLIAGWVLASLLLCAAIIREVGDRALDTLSRDSAARALGLNNSEMRTVHRWSILTPLVVSVPAGYVAAIAFAIFGHSLGFTIYYVGRITLVAGLVALLAIVTVQTVFHIHRRISDEG